VYTCVSEQDVCDAIARARAALERTALDGGKERA
jgi:hypothetical protein